MKAIYVDMHDLPANVAQRPVRSIMSHPVISVGVMTPLSEALRTMVGHGLRHLSVLDDAQRCVGVLSDRAIAAAWAADPTSLAGQTVSTVLDPTPATIAVGAHILDAARLMRDAATDAVAVLDAEGVVVGIVTGSDLIALLAQ